MGNQVAQAVGAAEEAPAGGEAEAAPAAGEAEAAFPGGPSGEPASGKGLFYNKIVNDDIDSEFVLLNKQIHKTTHEQIVISFFLPKTRKRS